MRDPSAEHLELVGPVLFELGVRLEQTVVGPDEAEHPERRAEGQHDRDCVEGRRDRDGRARRLVDCVRAADGTRRVLSLELPEQAAGPVGVQADLLVGVAPRARAVDVSRLDVGEHGSHRAVEIA